MIYPIIGYVLLFPKLPERIKLPGMLFPGIESGV